jgi:hypothetical protein
MSGNPLNNTFSLFFFNKSGVFLGACFLLRYIYLGRLIKTIFCVSAPSRKLKESDLRPKKLIFCVSAPSIKLKESDLRPKKLNEYRDISQLSQVELKRSLCACGCSLYNYK